MSSPVSLWLCLGVLICGMSSCRSCFKPHCVTDFFSFSCVFMGCRSRYFWGEMFYRNFFGSYADWNRSSRCRLSAGRFLEFRCTAFVFPRWVFLWCVAASFFSLRITWTFKLQLRFQCSQLFVSVLFSSLEVSCVDTHLMAVVLLVWLLDVARFAPRLGSFCRLRYVKGIEVSRSQAQVVEVTWMQIRPLTQVLGVVVFNYTFVVTLPSWINEKVMIKDQTSSPQRLF